MQNVKILKFEGIWDKLQANVGKIFYLQETVGKIFGKSGRFKQNYARSENLYLCFGVSFYRYCHKFVSVRKIGY